MSNTNREKWHVKKEIDLSFVITVVILFSTTLWFFAGIDKRVDANAKDIVHIKSQRTEDQRRIEKLFDTVNNKLDDTNKLLNQILTK